MRQKRLYFVDTQSILIFKMKSSKKQINFKNQVKEKKSASGIEAFFKSAPKTFVVEKNNAEIEPKDDAKMFFVDILKEKLRARAQEYAIGDDSDQLCHQSDGAVALENECGGNAISTEPQIVTESRVVENVAGCVECVEWEQKYKQEVEQRKELKKVYVNLTIRFSELHSKYEDLLKATSKFVDQSGNDGAAAASNEEIREDDILTDNEKKFLRCMPLDKKHDCTFVLQGLKFVYEDPSVLVLKSLKGTAERIEISNEGEQVHRDGKDPLTPKKVELIKSLFIERISKCKIDAADYAERIKDSYMNRLFGAGIKNLSKKFK